MTLVKYAHGCTAHGIQRGLSRGGSQTRCESLMGRNQDVSGAEKISFHGNGKDKRIRIGRFEDTRINLGRRSCMRWGEYYGEG